MSLIDNSNSQKVGHEKGFIPQGTDYPILEKIKWADSLYSDFGTQLLKDVHFREVLSRYKRAIEATSKIMEQTGVLAQCSDCAINDGGSCCGKGIEDKFTVALLLLNRLLGVTLNKEREDSEGCWFLGQCGCKITARHTICVNYLCKRLQTQIPLKDLQLLQQFIGAEVDAAFIAEEELKKWFQKQKI